MGDCGDVCIFIFKIFVFLILLGPLILATLVLLLIAIIADMFVMLYFITFGFLGEIECKCCCHGPFLVEALSKPWGPIFNLFQKVRNFFEKGLSDEIERNTVKISEKGPFSYR